MEQLKRNKKIRAAIGMLVVVGFAIVLYLPASQQYAYDHAYLNDQTKGINGYDVGLHDGYLNSTVEVKCPYRADRPIFSTDPRYDPVKGKAYCAAQRDRYTTVVKPYFQPALLILLFGLFLIKFLRVGYTTLSLKQEVAVTKQIRQQRQQQKSREKGR